MTTPPNRHVRLLAFALLLFLLGMALLPLSGLSAERIHWVNFAGIYEPDLDVISDDKGAPGSSFFLVGEGYPPFAQATIYVDGDPKCTVMTNVAGIADFIIQTYPGDPYGEYDITLSTGPNMSDTDDIELEDDEPVIDPPPGWNGVFCDLFGPNLTPTPTAGAPTDTATAGAPTNTPTSTLPPSTDTPPTATPTLTATPTPLPPALDNTLYLPVIMR